MPAISVYVCSTLREYTTVQYCFLHAQERILYCVFIEAHAFMHWPFIDHVQLIEGWSSNRTTHGQTVLQRPPLGDLTCGSVKCWPLLRIPLQIKGKRCLCTDIQRVDDKFQQFKTLFSCVCFVHFAQMLSRKCENTVGDSWLCESYSLSVWPLCVVVEGGGAKAVQTADCWLESGYGCNLEVNAPSFLGVHQSLFST